MKRYTVTIAAGRSHRIERAGSLFRIARASFAFTLSVDDKSDVDVESGYEVNQPFERIVLTNNHATKACRVTYYLGTGGVSIYQSYQLPPTVTRGTRGTLGSGGALPATSLQDSSGRRRAWVLIQNRNSSGSNELIICDGDGSSGPGILPGKEFLLATDDDFTLRNDGGSDINYALLFAFYA